MKSFNKTSYDFIAKDMTFKDDGYHKTKKIFGEWWYFDAVFENGYSVNAFIGLLSRGKLGIVLPILHLYKDKKRLFNKRELRCFNEFTASQDKPHIVLSKKDFIKGYIDKKTGNAIYEICLEVGKQKIDLKFSGFMKPWMGKTPASKWGIMLPRAKVNGTLTINGQTIKVKGIGYHDHNWEFKISPSLKGWYWGRLGNNQLNLVWSKIIRSKYKDFLLAVFNESKTKYININPKKIDFEITNYMYDQRKKIPKDFLLKIEDKEIKLNVEMKTTGVYRHINFLFTKYWRYHVNVTGEISYKNYKEKIDAKEIIEYLKIS